MNHPSPVDLAKDDPWLLARLGAERDVGRVIVVPSSLRSPLPVLSEAALAIADAKRSSPRKGSSRNAKLAYRSWHDLELSRYSDQMLVSLQSADRALLLMDTLLRACVSRGLKVFNEDGEIRVGFEEHSVRVRITERLQKTIGSIVGLTEYDIQHKAHISLVPTSELIIAVKRVVHERRTCEKPGSSLEHQLNEVLENIVRGIAETKAWRAYIEQGMTLYRAESEARELERETRRALADEAERIASERRRQEAQFIAEANAWQQSKTILAYADHLAAIAAASETHLGAEQQAWIEWARRTAESMSPTSKAPIRVDKHHDDVTDA